MSALVRDLPGALKQLALLRRIGSSKALGKLRKARRDKDFKRYWKDRAFLAAIRLSPKGAPPKGKARKPSTPGSPATPVKPPPTKTKASGAPSAAGSASRRPAPPKRSGCAAW